MSNPFDPQQPYGPPHPGDADQPPEVPYPTAPIPTAPSAPDPSPASPSAEKSPSAEQPAGQPAGSATEKMPASPPTAKMPAPGPPPGRPPAGPQPPTFQPGKASLPRPQPEPEPKAYPKTSTFQPHDEPAGYGPPPDYAPPSGYGPPPGYAPPGGQHTPPPGMPSGPPAASYSAPPGGYSGPPSQGSFAGGYGGPPPPPGYGTPGYTGPPPPAPKKSNAPLIGVILAVALLLCGGVVTAGVLVVNTVTDRAKEAIEPITDPTLPTLPTDVPELPTDLPTLPTDVPDLPGEGKAFTVVYEVTGDGPADILYAEKLGEQPKRLSGVDLPWKLEVPMQGSALVLVSGFRTETGDGEISCRATVDGEEVAQRTRDGGFASATCTKMVLN